MDEIQCQVSLEEGAEGPDQGFRQGRRDHCGEGHLDQGLAYKLDHQLPPCRAGGLAYPNLDAAPRRASGHQGDEVDRGHQHDQGADARDPVGDRPAAGGLGDDRRLARGAEVRIAQGQRLEGELGAGAEIARQGLLRPGGGVKSALEAGR